MRQYAGYATAFLLGGFALAYKIGYRVATRRSEATVSAATSRLPRLLTPAEFTAALETLRHTIRRCDDFPKPGVVFRDFLPILASPAIFTTLISALYTTATNRFDARIDAVVGLDARGFLLAPALAQAYNVPCLVIRKSGKLPGEVVTSAYDKEYGSDVFALQVDAWREVVDSVSAAAKAAGAQSSGTPRVLIVDDVLATGGTLTAAIELIRKVGGHVAGCICPVGITELEGAERVKEATEAPVEVLLKFDDSME